MFDSRQKPDHDRYTATVTLLLMAFVVSPLVLFATRPAGYVAILGAVVFSLLCSGVAWTEWKWRSAPAISSIVGRPARAK